MGKGANLREKPAKPSFRRKWVILALISFEKQQMSFKKKNCLKINTGTAVKISKPEISSYRK